MNRIQVELNKAHLVEMTQRNEIAQKELHGALTGLHRAIGHLTTAIEATEASRRALHDSGLECWIDQLDHENGD